MVLDKIYSGVAINLLEAIVWEEISVISLEEIST